MKDGVSCGDMSGGCLLVWYYVGFACWDTVVLVLCFGFRCWGIIVLVGALARVMSSRGVVCP